MHSLKLSVKRWICRRRGHKYPEDWCHYNPNDEPVWWAKKTCRRCHNELWHRMVVW